MGGTLDPSRYQALFEAAPVALLVFDGDLVMRDANQAYLDAVGLALEEVVGHFVLDTFPDSPEREGVDQSQSLRELMDAAVTTGETQAVTGFRYDIPNRRGEFEPRYWNVVETPLVDDEGRVELVLHYTEDITELVMQRETQEETASANLDLRRRVAAAQEDLARRAEELEVLNERLRRASEHDRTVAQALQEALLTRLPVIAGIELAARYRPAAVEDQVGGDWFDALALPGGAVAVTIGDVLGHDIRAAALMGQVRSMLRAFAWGGAGTETTGATLQRLDEAMSGLGLATYASAVLAVVTPEADGSCTVRWANAGHPPPILVAPDGTTSLLGEADPSPLLGVAPGTPRDERTTTLAPGSALVLYTDGLVEAARDDIGLGIERARKLLERHHVLPPQERIDRVIAEAVGEQHHDDVAVLLVSNPA